MQLRDYQSNAVQSVYSHLRDHSTNPVVVIPTGGGKTPVLAAICQDIAKHKSRALILSHVKELVEQSAATVEALATTCPELQGKIGVYSAGLNRRDTTQSIIVAGIQSVYKRACELGKFDMIIVDEAHTIPVTGDGMYRQFLDDCQVVNPSVRVVGLTATPYRMSSGMICDPNNILHEVCYTIGVKELIERGFICPLISKGSKALLDTSSLHKRGGEYIETEVQALMDTKALVAAACQEILERTRERKSVLLFCAGVEHAKHIAACVSKAGSTACVFGDTPTGERAAILANFKAGEIKYLCNVNVLTTGFDAPNIDCVVMIRPTLSPGLYYQMVGRGFRIHPGKSECLIMDFGGNVVRHGPVDNIQIRKPREGSGPAPCKQCPKCQTIVPAGCLTCPECSYKWPKPEVVHEAKATNAPILSEPVEHVVLETKYTDYKKHGSSDTHPRTLRVEYVINKGDGVGNLSGIKRLRYYEWINLEHPNEYACKKAAQWWERRSHAPVPTTAKQASHLAKTGALCDTKSISVEKDGRYDRVIAHVLGVRPTWREAGDDDPGEEKDEQWDIDFEVPF